MLDDVDTTTEYPLPRFVTHITKAAWIDAVDASHPYAHPSLAAEGFIHTSLACQVLRTANRYRFINHVDPKATPGDALRLIVIDTTLLSTKYGIVTKVEHAPTSGEWFPHIFGAVPIDAIVARAEFTGPKFSKRTFANGLPDALAAAAASIPAGSAVVKVCIGRDAVPSAGDFSPPSFADDGFIHLATAENVGDVLNAFFANTTRDEDVWLLLIDATKLRDPSALKFEAAAPAAPGTALPPGFSGANFPHLYAPLNCDAIVARAPAVVLKEETFHRFEALPVAVVEFLSSAATAAA